MAHGDGNQADGHDHQDSHEAVELALERRTPALRLRERSGDTTELRVRASRVDDALTPAADHVGAREGHRVTVRGRGVRRVWRHDARFGRRFAREDAPVDLEFMRPDQPQVGRHDIANPQQDDVPGHEFRGGNLEDVAVAAHLGGRGTRLPERFERTLRPVLGDHVGAHDRHQADQDQHAVADLAQQDRQRAGGQEQQHERFPQGSEQKPGQGRTAVLGKLVSAAGQALESVCARQPDGGIHDQRCGDLRRRPRVWPVERGRRERVWGGRSRVVVSGGHATRIVLQLARGATAGPGTGLCAD